MKFQIKAIITQEYQGGNNNAFGASPNGYTLTTVPLYKDVIKYTLSMFDTSASRAHAPWNLIGTRDSVEACKTLARLHQANFIVEEFEL